VTRGSAFCIIRMEGTGVKDARNLVIDPAPQPSALQPLRWSHTTPAVAGAHHKKQKKATIADRRQARSKQRGATPRRRRMCVDGGQQRMARLCIAEGSVAVARPASTARCRPVPAAAAPGAHRPRGR